MIGSSLIKYASKKFGNKAFAMTAKRKAALKLAQKASALARKSKGGVTGAIKRNPATAAFAGTVGAIAGTGNALAAVGTYKVNKQMKDLKKEQNKRKVSSSRAASRNKFTKERIVAKYKADPAYRAEVNKTLSPTAKIKATVFVAKANTAAKQAKQAAVRKAARDKQKATALAAMTAARNRMMSSKKNK